MEIKATETNRNLLLKLEGEIDHHGAKDAMRALELELDAALPRKLILDFSGVTFMDSSGIALVMRAQQQMTQMQGTLLICHVPAQARRVFDAAGVSRLVKLS